MREVFVEEISGIQKKIKRVELFESRIIICKHAAFGMG